MGLTHHLKAPPQLEIHSRVTTIVTSDWPGSDWSGSSFHASAITTGSWPDWTDVSFSALSYLQESDSSGSSISDSIIVQGLALCRMCSLSRGSTCIRIYDSSRRLLPQLEEQVELFYKIATKTKIQSLFQEKHILYQELADMDESNHTEVPQVDKITPPLSLTF